MVRLGQMIRAGMVIAGLGAALPAFADDRDTLTALLEDNLSGAGRVVTITGFQGALSSQASIETLTIADDQGVWLTLSGVTLDWNRAALLGGTLAVQKLSADEIDLDRLPGAAPASGVPSPQATPFALPALPVAITLGEISTPHIVLGAPILGEKVEGTITADASLIGGQGHIRLVLDRLNGPAGHFSLIAVYANATNQLTLALQAAEDSGGLVVKALGVPGAPSLDMNIGGKGPLTAFKASMTLDTDGATRLAGQLETQGDGAGGTRFTADLAGNLAPLFAPDYAAFFGDRIALHAQGQRAADGRLTLPDLSLTAATLDLKGSVSIAPDGLPDKVALTGTLQGANGAPVLLPLGGTATRVGSADLSVEYQASQSQNWTASLTATALDRADLRADQVEINGSGLLRHGDQAGVTAKVTLDAVGLSPADPALARALGTEVDGTGTVDWQAGSGKVAVSDLSLHAGDAILTTQGSISGFDTGFRMEGRIGLTAADLTRFAALAGRPLAGGVALDLTGWVAPLTGAFDGDLAADGRALQTGAPQADGFLTGASHIVLSGARDASGTTLRHLTLDAGGLTTDLTGTIAKAGASLQGQVRLADLSRLNLGLSGAAMVQGSFTGLPQDGHLRVTGTGQDLAMGQAQADALGRGATALDLDLHLSGTRVQIAKAEITGALGSLTASGAYDPAGSDVTAHLSLPDAGVLQSGWKGALDAQVRLSGTTDAALAAVSATSQGLGIGQPMLDRLIGGAGQLDAKVQLRQGRIEIDGLTFATPALTASATGQPEALTVKARLADLGLVLPEFPGALIVEGAVNQTASGTGLDLTLRGPGQINASLAGTLAPDLSQARLTAKGSAQAGLANLLIAPRVAAGQVTFDLALNGPLRLSSVSGQASLSEGRLADPSQPVSLQHIQAQARLAGGAADLTVDGAIATGGKLHLAGRVGLTPPLPADLAITLTGAVLRDPQLFTTRINGDLRFAGPALGGAKITGTLALAATELRIPSTGVSSLPALQDLRHLSDAPQVRATRQRAGFEAASARGATGGGGYGLDILVKAPNQIFIRGRGLDAELGGQVRLTGTTAAIVPAGALSLIRGRLDLLGKRLTLSEATLQMQGALVPYVRIAATTSSDGFAISAVIEGDATNPAVSFTATPDLPQEEALARLLFDKGLQSLSAFQAAQLASAVATLAGKGGEGVIGKLRKSAGLDNLDVQSDGTGNTSVTAGKYLSKKVYTEVTVDQTGKSTVNLNLDLSPHVTLRGRVDDSGQTGLGIYLERDY